MTNRRMKAVSHQPSAIRHPATGIQHPLSPNHQSTIINHRGLLPLHRTFPDNSRGGFVLHVAQKALEFCVEPSVAVDNSHVNCHLVSSSRFAALAQTKCRPRLTPGGKNHVRTKRIQSRAPTPFVRPVRANGGQFKERKPSARQSGERRAKGGEPSRGSHSGSANPGPSPPVPSPPKKPGEFERNLASSKKHGDFRRRKPGEFEKSRESGSKSQETIHSPLTSHHSPLHRNLPAATASGGRTVTIVRL